MSRYKYLYTHARAREGPNPRWRPPFGTPFGTPFGRGCPYGIEDIGHPDPSRWDPIWDPIWETSGDLKPPFARDIALVKVTKSPDFISFYMFAMLKTPILAILASHLGYPRTPPFGGPFGTPFGTSSGSCLERDQAVLHPISWATAVETSRYPSIMTSGGALQTPPNTPPFRDPFRAPKGVPNRGNGTFGMFKMCKTHLSLLAGF